MRGAQRSGIREPVIHYLKGRGTSHPRPSKIDVGIYGSRHIERRHTQNTCDVPHVHLEEGVPSTASHEFSVPRIVTLEQGVEFLNGFLPRGSHRDRSETSRQGVLLYRPRPSGLSVSSQGPRNRPKRRSPHVSPIGLFASSVECVRRVFSHAEQHHSQNAIVWVFRVGWSCSPPGHDSHPFAYISHTIPSQLGQIVASSGQGQHAVHLSVYLRQIDLTLFSGHPRGMKYSKLSSHYFNLIGRNNK